MKRHSSVSLYFDSKTALDLFAADSSNTKALLLNQNLHSHVETQKTLLEQTLKKPSFYLLLGVMGSIIALNKYSI